MEKSLKEVKNALYDIQDKLYSGEIRIDELNEILGKLKYLKENMEKITEENNYCNDKINNILKGWKMIFTLLPLLCISLMIANILNLIIGIISLLITSILRWIVKRGIYLENIEQEKNKKLINQLLEDIEYKKEITNKKINTVKRLTSLEKEHQETNFTQTKIPKIKMVRILELKN